jgi:hypothetical protein
MKVIDELIESARLAGSTQAKRGYGVYTQDDAIMERAFWEGVEARAKAIRDEVAALKAERDAQLAIYGEVIDNLQSQVDELVAALKGVIRVADRKTDEFDAARAAIAKAEGGAAWAIPPAPAWHDAPTEPGIWLCFENGYAYTYPEEWDKGFAYGEDSRWYGPIPQDGEKS